MEAKIKFGLNTSMKLDDTNFIVDNEAKYIYIDDEWVEGIDEIAKSAHLIKAVYMAIHDINKKLHKSELYMYLNDIDYSHNLEEIKIYFTKKDSKDYPVTTSEVSSSIQAQIIYDSCVNKEKIVNVVKFNIIFRNINYKKLWYSADATDNFFELVKEYFYLCGIDKKSVELKFRKEN